VTILKLYYDGWLALPPMALQQLGVNAGGVLEAELADDGTIRLRPVSVAKSAGEDRQQELAENAAAPEPEPIRDVPDEVALPVKRRPGRPRKAAMVAAPQPASAMDEAQGAVPEETAQPELEATPVLEAGARSELRRKVALPTSFSHIPIRGRRAERLFTSTGYEREERRPFRNVEVRKLGPGRGHNKTGRLAS
jgi:antitoxin component of MazEF toxin-antitoxin module